MPDFLLEIGTEEIPARMIAAAAQDLYTRTIELLTANQLAPQVEKGGIFGSHYSTPRRLSVLFPGMLARQTDSVERLTGPAITVAFKDGQPTPAAHAFA